MGTNPSRVKVGLYITDFADFDMIANKFTFSGILWFLFDPSTVSLKHFQNSLFKRVRYSMSGTKHSYCARQVAGTL